MCYVLFNYLIYVAFIMYFMLPDYVFSMVRERERERVCVCVSSEMRFYNER